MKNLDNVMNESFSQNEIVRYFKIAPENMKGASPHDVPFLSCTSGALWATKASYTDWQILSPHWYA